MNAGALHKRLISFRTMCVSSSYHLRYRHLSTSRSVKANHYEVLGIEQTASADDIRSAFLKLSKECHPDVNIKDPNKHKKFVLVNEAYSVLSKPSSRQDYDLVLTSRTSSSSSYSRAAQNSSSGFHHHPRHFHDEQIYSMRDKSKDAYYKSKPHYGFKGIEHITNFQIVAGCFIFMLVGILFHYVAVKRSSSLHIKSLDERDMKTHELWITAKKNAETYTSEDRNDIFEKQASHQLKLKRILQK